jgi:hypothetical protein
MSGYGFVCLRLTNAGRIGDGHLTLHTVQETAPDSWVKEGVESVEQLCEVRALQSAIVFAPRHLRVQRSRRNESGSPLPLYMEFTIGMLMHVDISAVTLRPNGNLNRHRRALSGVDLLW